MYFVYLIGPAGSGKSTLTKVLSENISQFNQELNVITLNLDPAVRKLPYAPSIDIQDYVTVDQIIEETGLGPNGAIIAATDKMINHIDDIKYEISEYNEPDFVLIDTPGQMELFAFRNTGPMIASALGFGNVQRGTLFCYDANMCGRPNGLVSTLLLASSVQYRFPNIPQVNVLTKKDLLTEEKLETMLSWMEDEDILSQAVEEKERGMIKEMTLSVFRAFREMGNMPELVPISALKNEGIDELFGAVQRMFNDDCSKFYY